MNPKLNSEGSRKSLANKGATIKAASCGNEEIIMETLERLKQTLDKSRKRRMKYINKEKDKMHKFLGNLDKNKKKDAWDSQTKREHAASARLRRIDDARKFTQNKNKNQAVLLAEKFKLKREDLIENLRWNKQKEIKKKGVVLGKLIGSEVYSIFGDT